MDRGFPFVPLMTSETGPVPPINYDFIDDNDGTLLCDETGNLLISFGVF